MRSYSVKRSDSLIPTLPSTSMNWKRTMTAFLAVIILYSYSILSPVIYPTPLTILATANAQPDLSMTKYRDLVIDLGNGIKTNAQLTLPVVGQGQYPGILLITGSGAEDMKHPDHYLVTYPDLGHE